MPSAAVGAPVAGAEGVSDDGAGARPAVASDDGAEDGAWSAGADAEGTAAALLSALPPGASPARPETVISSEGFSTVVEVTWPALFVAVTTACAVSMFSSGSEPPAGASPARPETSSAVPAGPFGAELEPRRGIGRCQWCRHHGEGGEGREVRRPPVPQSCPARHVTPCSCFVEGRPAGGGAGPRVITVDVPGRTQGEGPNPQVGVKTPAGPRSGRTGGRRRRRGRLTGASRGRDAFGPTGPAPPPERGAPPLSAGPVHADEVDRRPGQRTGEQGDARPHRERERREEQQGRHERPAAGRRGTMYGRSPPPSPCPSAW